MQVVKVSVNAGDEMDLQVCIGDVLYSTIGIVHRTEVKVIGDIGEQSLRFMVELGEVDGIVVSEVMEGE